MTSLLRFRLHDILVMAYYTLNLPFSLLLNEFCSYCVAWCIVVEDPPSSAGRFV